MLLTKTDLAQDPATLSDIAAQRRRIAGINPSAPILDRQVDWSDVRALLLGTVTYDLRNKSDDALAWLKAEHIHNEDMDDHHHEHTHDHRHTHDHSHLDRTRHGDDIQSHVIVLDEPVRPLVFYLFLEALKISAGTDLLRIKGLFALSDDPDKPVVVHGVQHLIHPIDKLEHWPAGDKSTKIVLIGRNLKIGSFCEILKSSPKR